MSWQTSAKIKRIKKRRTAVYAVYKGMERQRNHSEMWWMSLWKMSSCWTQLLIQGKAGVKNYSREPWVWLSESVLGNKLSLARKSINATQQLWNSLSYSKEEWENRTQARIMNWVELTRNRCRTDGGSKFREKGFPGCFAIMGWTYFPHFSLGSGQPTVKFYPCACIV